MQRPMIADFRDKIQLCKATTTVDSELNRVESIVPVQVVWAKVEAKNANVVDTVAGNRPQIHYTITIRQQNLVACDYIQYRSKRLRVTAPYISLDGYKYIQIEAVEIVP